MASIFNLVLTVFCGACIIGYSMASSITYDGKTYEYSLFDTYHGKAPRSPEEISPIMRLYTKNTPKGEGEILNRNEPQTITKSQFKATRPTKFIIHGFTENGMTEQYVKMKDAYLENYDVNVILVDWRTGAAGNYLQSRADTRVIGHETAAFIDVLSRETGADLATFHVIGHSLGAHVAGYAGEALTTNKIGRITGLDPAGPLFGGDNVKPNYRLDKTDALFVDIIHTDGDLAAFGGMGLMDQLGHQDFYPNGGKDMPGCNIDVTDMTETLFCDHRFSVQYFTDTISIPDRYPAITYHPGWMEKVIGGMVYEDCSDDKPCPMMGDNAQPGREGAFYVKTE